ncbi:hypothetical protein B0T17DRAFT_485648 [Bombardia bombarda]|uniref:Uncharacterized protein n=1 Tax=Bombardia bombarda TaxID=252184 RepID=A0AA39XQ49_9PEZI|nr:hypothetical protein B0T17DRAFT_485648 [Bombardia bombarda]
MPIPFIGTILFEGFPPWFPEPWNIAKAGTALGALFLTKWYASGAVCLTEKNLHGRVILITGGTSGIGAATVFELAKRGAQVVLLTHVAPSDPFLVDFIEDMRERTENQLIYAEQVDLSSLHSVRQFATRWVDNLPARRLDTIILCAATMTPPGHARTETAEGIEQTWMVNYLANFHLLGILSPAIRAQPFDRDVRIILPTCSSYISSPPLDAAITTGTGNKKDWTPTRAYARSKLALMVLGKAYQKHLDAYKRPDELPMNARVVLVDPGLARTPGMRRWLSRGTVWGLLMYVVLYALSWLFLKSSEMACQSILYAVLDGSILRGSGAKLIKECIEVNCARKDVDDEEVAKKLWEASDKLIEKTEKEQALLRAAEKAERERREKEEKREREVKEQKDEIEALVGAIKKGKAKGAQKEREKGVDIQGKEREKEKGKGGKKAKGSSSSGKIGR